MAVGQKDLDAAGLRVPRDIVHRLLDHAVERDLDLGCQGFPPRADDLELDVGFRILALEDLGELAQRGNQSQMIEGDGAQVHRQAVQILQDAVGGCFQVADALADHRRVVHVLLEEMQIHDLSGKNLTDLIVQFARDPCAFHLLRADQMVREGAHSLGGYMLPLV